MEAGDVAMTSPLFSLLIRTKGVFRQKDQRTKDNFSAFIRTIRAIRGRFSSERNYHNYHNYPRNIISYGTHSLFRVSVYLSVSSAVKLHFVQFESNSVQCLAAGD